MNWAEAMRARHSVRQYLDKPLEAEVISALKEEIDACNEESGLHIQAVVNESKAFDGFMAHYGRFRGVRNYLALIGEKGSGLEEKCGYYGERLVLRAQELGLNTCWVALTYSKIKTAFVIGRGEKLCAVVALGYGKNQGTAHDSKAMDQLMKAEEPVPAWFRKGMEAALLAPTAMNQQKFLLIQEGNRVTAKAGAGFYTKLDLGIVKYHFEVGAGRDNFEWA